MYAAVTLVILVCLTATTHADHHQPCHSPNMTGFMSAVKIKGEMRAFGAFTYDSMGKKLRFRSNESNFVNASLSLDLLMFFEEGVFYEIDSKNQTCEKKALQCTIHPLQIPDDARFLATVNSGNPSIEGEGLKINAWVGSMPFTKGFYSMSVTMGCLPVFTMYLDETTVMFSLLDVENEIKDPDLLVVPSFCQGLPVEETPEGTVNSFLNEFM
ncbi:ependymin isoform X2 [Paralichthys olivaceus]|uniref:ependymin isoform X2 n=1 Tax=Paralichthys olivaceus TaxID=8255 RepID=UPI00097CEFB1|nr:PREDICTED: ependymin-1-like isoform X2 [Paralichthys olivaceus]